LRENGTALPMTSLYHDTALRSATKGRMPIGAGATGSLPGQTSIALPLQVNL
jgi:hypothetical protein